MGYKPYAHVGLALSPLDDLFDRLQANIDERGLPRRYGSQPALDGFAHLGSSTLSP